MPAATAAPGVIFEFADPPRIQPEVRTDIVGFVGVAERGPFHRPVRIESWHQYESVFGGFRTPGFLALAVHAFFGNGGRTCDVVRALVPPGAGSAEAAKHAWTEVPLIKDDQLVAGTLRIIATSPGTWGNGITIEVIPRLQAIANGAFRLTLIVRTREGTTWRLADCSFDRNDSRFLPGVMAATPDLPVRLAARHTGMPDEESALRTPWINEPWVSATMPLTAELRLASGTVELREGRDGVAQLTVDHLCGDETAQDERVRWGLGGLIDTDDVAMVAIPDAVPFPRLPESQPRPLPPSDCRTLGADPADVAKPPDPGPAEYPRLWALADTKAMSDRLIHFCQLRGDCVALLDPPPELLTPEKIQDYRTSFDSSYAGLYWPWLQVERRPRSAPIRSRRPTTRDYGRREGPESVPSEPMIEVPPSGMVAGLTAAADLLVGPHRAPAGQTARGAIRVTVPVDDDDHGSLNARGINVLRERVGRGVVLEGTRSLALDQKSANPWRHLNVRRTLLAILEAIEERTQWAVFEPNNQRLWADLRDVVRSFLTRRWRLGWLAGLRPEEAFSVQCDEATNPPESLELGRVVALLALHFPPPIEWLVVRIGRSSTGVEVLDVDRA